MLVSIILAIIDQIRQIRFRDKSHKRRFHSKIADSWFVELSY